jgi:16S rRNA (uracil1498-N3)-methyltransferase
MRISRLFVETALRRGATLTLDARAAHYVSQVLRLRPGQALTLFDGSGLDHAATLLRCDRQACTAEVGDCVAEEPTAALHIALGIGMSRGERMDFAIQKAVELGVGAITPLHTERSLVQLTAERQRKRVEHWRGVLISACEQSGRSRLPGLEEPVPLSDWLARHRGGLLLHHAAAQTLADLAAPGTGLSLLIGPEGGLSAAERELAGAHDFTAVRLGPRVLRTETAPLAAIAAVQMLWGDFRR